MFSCFSKGKDSIVFEKQICEKLLDEVVTLVPTLEHQAILIRKDLETNIKQEIEKNQIGHMFENCVNKVSNAITIVDYKPAEDVKIKVKEKIDASKLIIELNQELSDPENDI